MLVKLNYHNMQQIDNETEICMPLNQEKNYMIHLENLEEPEI